MKPLDPIHNSPIQVIDLEEERRIEKEVQGLIDLHDFIKSHPDAPVKEIARFMPPVDSRVVSKAIQEISLREEAKRKTKYA
jgi:hypothetical protein